jgi:uncharacterized membrane protein YsdA (DUF1294 family)/cold shock CspA family protein
MKKQGKVVRWDSTRAFGFIRSPDTPADIFFHIRDFQGLAAPQDGMAVSFEEIHVGGKGPRAMAVNAIGSRESRKSESHPSVVPRPTRTTNAFSGDRAGRAQAATSSSKASAGIIMMLIPGWAMLVLWGIWAGRLPMLTLAAMPILNLMTFYVYWQDKHAAQTGRWRIKEDTLHLLGVLGGWPGAWFAHQILRHKSRKIEFQATYWATVLIHCAALVGWLFWLQSEFI